ncbi:saccharopine dehydrogenase [Mrakia frigida]|uniref:saccharopine dehydrogenase n=1 Tax=Mrakia frigida TaxID=29902 RepID=UPI003FCC1C43
MSNITHPSIVDGWFREISDQWPGQAMTLKVKKVLHTEKSLFQDVLVFESETYGNVLVLDGVVQATERDEFSYQEMITHIPMASHPNPKHVLVVGGGDGGVIREVLKHASVESVVLVDIDEAVPRVSKLYLPGMADVLSHPKVTVHIADGFKYLPTVENSFDVIITDSSDPVGPAASLFEAPYFTLMKAALKEGGSLSTQGESLWLHLPLIKDLRTMTKHLFPVSEYAFTTIPTYPSGQIGFVVCSKDANRKVSVPLREVPNCRYYNARVHSASFVLPEFGRAMIEEGKDLLTGVFSGVNTSKLQAEKVAAAAGGKTKKKVLLLGSGFVAGPAAEYIVRKGNDLTIACRTLSTALSLSSTIPGSNPVSVDVTNAAELDALVAKHDLVVSLIPYTYHTLVIESAIRNKNINVVTTSYVSEAMKALDQKAIDAGVLVFNEIGLDPGIDHLWAVKTFHEVHAEGGKIKEFLSYCGGLPAPECSNNPLGYKFSWSSRGVLLALRNSAKYHKGGKLVEVDGKDLMTVAQPYYITPAFGFVAYPNRDSTSFIEAYGIPEAETCVRGTLRYQGFPQVVAALVEMGFLNDEEVAYVKKGGDALTWAEVMAKAIGAKEPTEDSIIATLLSLKSFQPAELGSLLISKLRRLGLFSSNKVTPRGNLLDTLCATLEEECKYAEGERDLVMLQHKFVVERADGKIETLTSTLEAYGSSTGGPSAMALTVGVPCGVAVQLILDGVITKKGVQQPYDEETCAILRTELEKEGITMKEEVL